MTECRLIVGQRWGTGKPQLAGRAGHTLIDRYNLLLVVQLDSYAMLLGGGVWRKQIDRNVLGSGTEACKGSPGT